uniref:Uncharacterized protein n=1 Tax=Romanomermis culicivorax TaxID=13658 RepID=A0A915L067_ROMCU
MYRPPSTSTLTSAESKITSGVKRRRQTTTSNVGVKKPRRVAAASTGLLIAAPKALPPTPVTPALPPAINFKDKKVKEEIHDMFVDQIRNDCTLMFDAPQ